MGVVMTEHEVTEHINHEDAGQGRHEALSVVNPIGEALSHMVPILFKPFVARTWFGLGFMLFMTTNVLGFVSMIMVQVAANGIPLVIRERGDLQPGIDWYFANTVLFWSYLVGGLLVFGVVLTVLSWLRSRGIIMFLHGVATGSGNVREAWAISRVPGNSLFLWRILISTSVLLGVLVAVLVLWVGTLTSGGAANGDGGGVLGMPIWSIVVASLIMAVSLFMGLLINVIVDLVVVPAMYVRQVTMKVAVSDLRRELLPGRFWLFVGFVFFQFLLQTGSNVAIQTILMLTCGLMLVPYLGSVLMLPAIFPLVGYQLGYYQQFGIGWQTLPLKPVVDGTGPVGAVPPPTPIIPVEPGEIDSEDE